MSNLKQALVVFFGALAVLGLLSFLTCSTADETRSCSVGYIFGWAARGAGLALLFWFWFRPEPEPGDTRRSVVSRGRDRMRVPERGAQRYVAAAVTMTVVWGLVFGLIDDELGRVANWLYAAVVGAVFAVLIAISDRYARRR